METHCYEIAVINDIKDYVKKSADVLKHNKCYAELILDQNERLCIEPNDVIRTRKPYKEDEETVRSHLTGNDELCSKAVNDFLMFKSASIKNGEFLLGHRTQIRNFDTMIRMYVLPRCIDFAVLELKEESVFLRNNRRNLWKKHECKNIKRIFKSITTF